MDPDAPVLSSAVAGPIRPVVRSGAPLTLAVAACRTLALALHAAQRHRLRVIARLLESGQRLLGALLAHGLTAAEQSRLTVATYDAHPAQRAAGDGLFGWEQGWFERRLPRPPARVLVGGCGNGREAVALAALGHHVVAFDPAAACVAECRQRLPSSAVLRLSYEQLAAALLDAAPADDAADALRRQRFDAVLLGCGSLSHVLDERERRRLVRALDLLCPTGPLLVSFAFASQTPRTGRAERAGRRIGRALARLRGLAPPAAGLVYRPHHGFAVAFGASAIEALARAAGREAAWERGTPLGQHHATLLPARGAG